MRGIHLDQRQIQLTVDTFNFYTSVYFANANGKMLLKKHSSQYLKILKQTPYPDNFLFDVHAFKDPEFYKSDVISSRDIL